MSYAQHDWTVDAACKGKTFLFFAPARERPPARATREALARAICAECPVLIDCRKAAQGEFGIWAGEPEDVFLSELTSSGTPE